VLIIFSSSGAQCVTCEWWTDWCETTVKNMDYCRNSSPGYYASLDRSRNGYNGKGEQIFTHHLQPLQVDIIQCVGIIFVTYSYRFPSFRAPIGAEVNVSAENFICNGQASPVQTLISFLKSKFCKKITSTPV
jgi:hypothetical protein